MVYRLCRTFLWPSLAQSEIVYHEYVNMKLILHRRRLGDGSRSLMPGVRKAWMSAFAAMTGELAGGGRPELVPGVGAGEIGGEAGGRELAGEFGF